MTFFWFTWTFAATSYTAPLHLVVVNIVSARKASFTENSWSYLNFWNSQLIWSNLSWDWVGISRHTKEWARTSPVFVMEIDRFCHICLLASCSQSMLVCTRCAPNIQNDGYIWYDGNTYTQIFGSRPSDHYFRSVCLPACLPACLSVCLWSFFLSRLSWDAGKVQRWYCLLVHACLSVTETWRATRRRRGRPCRNWSISCGSWRWTWHSSLVRLTAQTMMMRMREDAVMRLRLLTETEKTKIMFSTTRCIVLLVRRHSSQTKRECLLLSTLVNLWLRAVHFGCTI